MILGDLFVFLSEYFWRNYIFQLEGITVGFFDTVGSDSLVAE